MTSGPCRPAGQASEARCGRGEPPVPATMGQTGRPPLLAGAGCRLVYGGDDCRAEDEMSLVPIPVMGEGVRVFASAVGNGAEFVLVPY